MRQDHTIARSFRILVLLGLFAGAASAQSNAADASLEGYVLDPSGAGIDGAAVTAHNLNTGARFEAAAGSNGYYRFPIVNIGAYDVSVTAPGFKESTRAGVALSTGQHGRVDFRMEVGQTSESIKVTADPSLPGANASGSAVGGILSDKQVEELANPSRNIYNLYLLSPGVQGPLGVGFGTPYFSFGGNQRATWTLDGLDNTERDTSRQIRMVIVTPDAVEEMQVLANGYSAEFGRAAGGQLNVILKSGTNAFHGSETFLYRPNAWQARPSLTATRPNSTFWDEGVTFGGRIKKDRLFFFSEYETNPYDTSAIITVLPAYAAALNLPSSQFQNVPSGYRHATLVGKSDYRINDRNWGYIRYARFMGLDPTNVSGLVTANRGLSFTDRQNAGGFQLATVFTPALLNEFRFGGIERGQLYKPLGTPEPYRADVNIAAVADIGYSPTGGSLTRETSLQVIDNVTWTRGRNTWKAGIDLDRTMMNLIAAQNPVFTFGGLAAVSGVRGAVSSLNQYLYTVQGLEDPATRKPYTYSTFTETGGNPQLDVAFHFVNWFVQDEIRATRRLTINAGIRYEAILFPQFDPNAPYPLSRKINNDLKDFAPRISVSWLATNDAKTVVRAAFGTYYDTPGLSIFYNAAETNGDPSRLLNYQISGSNPGAPVFPNVPSIAAAANIVKPSINAFAPGYKTPYQIQANFQIQRELAPNLILTAGYNYAAERHGLFAENVNLGAPVGYLSDGRSVFGSVRANPSFNAINLIETGADTNYNGLFISIQKRLSAGFMMQLSYTWSHALADSIGEGTVIEDRLSLKRDYGNANTDVRHSLAAQGLYEPRFRDPLLKWMNGFEISSILDYNSGYPINTLSGVDLNNDGVLNDRPLFRSQNDLVGPAYFQLNGRLGRSLTLRDRYRVSVFLESDNVLNSTLPACNTSTGCTNVVVHTAGARDFGRLTTALTARTAQFGVKFAF